MSAPCTPGPAPGVQRQAVAREGLVAAASHLLGQGYRLALVAGSAPPGAFQVAYAFARGDGARAELVVDMPEADAWVPTIAGISYTGGRFEREVADLFGIPSRGHPQPSRLVKHGHWPQGWYPMRHDDATPPPFEPDVGSFPFLEVAGEGVYEIPVGPVHAGLIEPGHFRFSVMGETIIRMKARLWFLHRGVEKLFEGRLPDAGMELAERVSGDTAVGHGLAYAMAVEEALGVEVGERDRLVRAMLLELERLYNHVGDIGAILNDVAYGIAHAHTQRLRERLLRVNAATTGHRLLRGGVVVGGSRLLASPDVAVVRQCASDLAEVVAIALDHSIVADRLTGTAVLSREHSERIGALGYVARASGHLVDARVEHPFADLGEAFEPVVEQGGDVLARLLVRAREVAMSTDLVEHLVARVGSAVSGDVEPTGVGRGGDARGEQGGRQGRPGGGQARPSGGQGVGLSLVEAWRGTACHRVEVGPDGTLARVKVVDPSFFTWPALPVALRDTIVPDFPLANKSFNQSYAGNDL